MAHISGHDRSQLLLLPEVVEDYVAADNPVRFIEAFVDGLDLAALWVYWHGSEGDGSSGLWARTCMGLDRPRTEPDAWVTDQRNRPASTAHGSAGPNCS